VARYYLTEARRPLPASTEITGYAASAFVYLHSVTHDERYLDRAHAAAGFLVRAWDPASGTMPFEIDPAEFSYFFDCGIIVRGLLAVWRATGETQFLDTAIATGDSMIRDFAGPAGDSHPILALPSKAPVDRDPLRWSRTATCYQLKSAMAWSDLHEATGENRFLEPYERVLDASLSTHADFLPGTPTDPGSWTAYTLSLTSSKVCCPAPPGPSVPPPCERASPMPPATYATSHPSLPALTSMPNSCAYASLPIGSAPFRSTSRVRRTRPPNWLRSSNYPAARPIPNSMGDTGSDAGAARSCRT